MYDRVVVPDETVLLMLMVAKLSACGLNIS